MCSLDEEEDVEPAAADNVEAWDEEDEDEEVIELLDDRPMKVQEGLYIGSYMAERNQNSLLRAGITDILQVAQGLFPHYPLVFNYMNIQVLDSPSEDLVHYFPKCFEFINRAISRGGSVLVHCAAGVSRSATVVLGYLMTHYRMELPVAVEHLKAIRPWVCPNTGFIKQLETYQGMAHDMSKWRAWHLVWQEQQQQEGQQQQQPEQQLQWLQLPQVAQQPQQQQQQSQAQQQEQQQHGSSSYGLLNGSTACSSSNAAAAAAGYGSGCQRLLSSSSPQQMLAANVSSIVGSLDTHCHSNNSDRQRFEADGGWGGRHKYSSSAPAASSELQQQAMQRSCVHSSSSIRGPDPHTAAMYSLQQHQHQQDCVMEQRAERRQVSFADKHGVTAARAAAGAAACVADEDAVS